jgi:hypothetical protein
MRALSLVFSPAMLRGRLETQVEFAEIGSKYQLFLFSIKKISY